jgi:hypothetical protein
MKEHLGLLLIACALAAAFFFSGKAPTVAGKVQIEEGTPRYHFYRGSDDADGSLEVPNNPTDLHSDFVMLNGKLFQDPDQRTALAKAGVHATYTSDYYFIDPGPRSTYDFGTWAGYYGGGMDSGLSRFQVGLRYSPFRIGLVAADVAPDLVVSKDVAGAGLSVYPASRFAGSFWRHIGLGAWYVIPTRSGTGDTQPSPGWVYGFAFSTRDN